MSHTLNIYIIIIQIQSQYTKELIQYIPVLILDIFVVFVICVWGEILIYNSLNVQQSL